MDREVVLGKLGARIRELRQERGFSQEQLALKAGLDRSYIGGVERGERNVAILNIKKIADALDLSIGEVWNNM